MVKQVLSKYPRTFFVLYLFAVTVLLDMALAQLFWEKLSTHPEYFARGFRCQDPYYHHGLKKNVSVQDRWGNLYTVTTNSLGFKDSLRRTVEVNPDRQRIILIGDSFTEGLGFPFEKTFAGIISDRMRERNTEVLNAAVASYSPKLYFLKMRYLLEILKIRCDKLFVFVDLSDMQDEIVYKEFIPGEHKEENSIKTYLKSYLIRHSVIGNVGDRIINTILGHLNRQPVDPEGQKYGVFDKKQAVREGLLYGIWKNYDEFSQERDKWYSEGNYARWGREGALLAKHHMEELVQLCRRHAIDVIIIVYPWPAQLWEGPENRNVLFWKSFAEEEHIRFMNLTPLFLTLPPEIAADRYFIPGDIHFNEAGHLLVASAFLKWYDIEFPSP